MGQRNKPRINNRFYFYYNICMDDWQRTTDALPTMDSLAASLSA